MSKTKYPPIILVMAFILMFAFSCPAQSSDVEQYKQEIKSAPEYQLIRVYEGNQNTEIDYQYEWKKDKWKRVKLKDGIWTKHDDKKPKKEKKSISIISQMLHTLNEWGNVFAAPEDSLKVIVNQSNREEIITFVELEVGATARYSMFHDYQSVELEDGATICRVRYIKTYIGIYNQGGSWTEYTDIL